MKRKAIWLIIGVLTIAAMILAACAPAGPTPTPGAAGKPEGDLIVGISSLAEEGFAPWRGEGGDQIFAWELVYDGLIYVIEKELKHVPGLAEKWEMSADGKSLTFTFRKGIKWHPGDWGEFTAEDMKYSLERYAEPGSQANRVSTARNIESMEVLDPYKLKINIKAGDPVWWMNFDMVMGNTLVPISKNYVQKVGDDEAFKTPVGTGPMNLVQHQRGSFMKFEALDTHWRVVTEFKTITVRIVPEESTRIAMLKTGEIDATAISGAKIPEVKAAGLGAGTAGHGGRWISYVFGGNLAKEDKRFKADYHRKDPWADIRVREAMNIALDRTAMNNAITGGTGANIYTPFFAPGGDKVKQYPYDLERAKKLMAEAGYANGFNITLYTWERPGTPEIPKFGEAMAGYWKAIGINAKIVPSDLATYRPTEQAGQTAGAIYPTRISVQTDASNELYQYVLPDARSPEFSDDNLTPIVRQLLPLSDIEKRNALWAQVMKYINENYLGIPVSAIQGAFGWNSKKVGEWPHGMAPQPGYWAYIRHATPRNTFRLFTP